jgi:hypothetical protein
MIIIHVLLMIAIVIPDVLILRLSVMMIITVPLITVILIKEDVYMPLSFVNLALLV